MCEWVPGPRLFQGGRRVFENDPSSDEESQLASQRNVVLRVSGALSVADATQLDVVSGQLPLSTSSSATEAKNPGPNRRRRRVRSEGSDSGCAGVVGAATHHDLILVDSADRKCPIHCAKIGSSQCATITQVGVGPRVSGCHSTVDQGQ